VGAGRAGGPRSPRGPRSPAAGARSPSQRRTTPAHTCGGRRLSRRLLERGEVEVADRVLDQPPVIGVVEHLARDLRGRLERQLGDLVADLLESALRLGLDLPPCFLEPSLAVGLRLVLDALPLRVGDAARLGEDVLRLAASLADQRSVLLEQVARFAASLVGLVERLADPLATLVDRLLDPAEREALQHPQGDREADDGPYHQAEADLDQRMRRDEPVHQTRTYARIEPSRP